MAELITLTALSIVAAGFVVGIVVGLTGMGGGALMTPALIFLGVGEAATVVTADLTAAAVYKTGGAIVHKREGSPHMQLAKWLIIGSVPMALLGPYLVKTFADPDDLDSTLKLCIGFALLFAAATYALRLYINLKRVRGGSHVADDNPPIRPLPTLLVGALGGLLVGITSVGSGSVIMIALLMLYPGLSAVKLVGTDLVQAVPLVMAAAISNIAHPRPRLGRADPAAHRVRPGHAHRRQDRPAGAAVDHPPRHRRRAHHERRRAARQGRLGARWAPARTTPTRCSSPGSASSCWSCCRSCGASSASARACRCSASPPSPSSRTRASSRASSG